MALDSKRVTVLGGGKKKVATRNRSGAATERYDVRWRVRLSDGGSRMFRQRFDRATEADDFVRRLQAVGLPGSAWILDDDGRPHDGPVNSAGMGEALTVWAGLLVYRAATWRTASGNGRKSAAPSLRAMGMLLRPAAPTMPGYAMAYLDLVAFRSDREPDDISALPERKLVHDGHLYNAPDLLDGRHFLEKWSLPLDQIDQTRVRALIAALGSGKAPSTEGRRWSQMRAVLRWWHEEGLVAVDLTSRVRGIRGTSVPTLGDDEPIPDESEMWRMAWALCLTGRPQYASLALVMGGAGLRIGECCELRRRDCIDEPGRSGMWLTVRGTLAHPGRSWTDSGEATERRGTKAKGPDGDLRGRRTYLPDLEANVLRTHLATYSGRGADARVYTSTTGKPLDVCHLQERAWKAARELAFPGSHRLHDVGRHAFRHLAVTRWLRQGVPLRTAARWGGWKDVATMLRWYESRLPGDDEYAARQMSTPPKYAIQTPGTAHVIS